MCVGKLSVFSLIQNRFNRVISARIFDSIAKRSSMAHCDPNLSLLRPPETVYGSTKLDKSLFEKTINVPCLIIRNVKVSAIMPVVKKYLLKMENFKPVQNTADQTLIYLNPHLLNKWEEFTMEEQKNLQALTINKLHFKELKLNYSNFSAEAIFKAVLPEDREGMASYTRIGHIVHVNLREHLIPFKELIGQVLYDKVSGCQTVVNKIDMIDNTYRNFQMEILQGDDNMVTQVKENKCTFRFDFAKVYWNSRLCTEHERICNLMKPGDVVFDVFAGVGPFSIPAAKKKCRVYANDLNPESYKWLQENCKINKINSDYLQAYNVDGKDFIQNQIKQFLPKHLTAHEQIYILMNLPATALEFLPLFIGLFDSSDDLIQNVQKWPTVIVYCFAKGEDPETITRNALFDQMGFNIEIIDVFKVRTVSSMKEMMRIKFYLDRDILISKKRKSDHLDKDAKKCDNGKEKAEEKQ